MDAVLGGYLETNTEGKIELRVKLWDILDQRELFSKIYIVINANNPIKLHIAPVMPLNK